MATSKPKIAITLGDPSGVGPEILAKLNWDLFLTKICPIIIGPVEIIAEAFKKFSNKEFKTINSLDQIENTSSNIYVLPSNTLKLKDLKKGFPNSDSGEVAFSAIKTATDLCISKLCDAMVTSPVSKEAIELAGYSFHGHTEWISERCGNFNEMMLMSSGSLHVAYATTHHPLKNVPNLLDEQRIIFCLEHLNDYLKKLKINLPIAVCGLNPHAGENGLLGKEEENVIIPAIKKAKSIGINCSGPYPADTLFIEANRKKYGAILAMYHDQGGIPFKMLAFENGVNHTLGLPIIRTSVDHGTAWDIAWQGKASTISMEAAIQLAIERL